MDELVRWLGEQLNEDERIARAVQQPDDSPWEAWHMVGEAAEGTVRWGVRGAGVQPSHEDPLNKARMEHIAAHDPARVLREIDAKRQLLDRYEELRATSKEDGLIGDVTEEYQDFLLRLLALPHADRPGYREEWRP